MSATSSSRTLEKQNNSQGTFFHSSSLGQVSALASPKKSSSELSYTEKSSAKKKVLNTKNSKKVDSQKTFSRQSSYKEFVTPSKIDGLKERLAAFMEHSTVKLENRRNIFQLSELKEPEQVATRERDLLKPLFPRRTELKSNVILDTQKISSEKEKLLQISECDSINDVIKNTEMANFSQQSQQSRNNTSSSSQKPQIDVSELFREGEEESETWQISGQNVESVKREAASENSSHNLKRNFGQLSTFPQSIRESDSSQGLASIKLPKKAHSDVFPKTITFFDHRKKNQRKFPVFSERELKFINQDLQYSIHETDADDDVETDDKQLDLAAAKVFEDLLEALNEDYDYKKIYRPHYSTDPTNSRKRVMNYSVTIPERHLLLENSHGATQESLKTLSSASTSVHTFNSTKPKEIIITSQKEQIHEEESVSNGSFARTFNQTYFEGK